MKKASQNGGGIVVWPNDIEAVEGAVAVIDAIRKHGVMKPKPADPTWLSDAIRSICREEIARAWEKDVT
jgi:hypothetical protein